MIKKITLEKFLSLFILFCFISATSYSQKSQSAEIKNETAIIVSAPVVPLFKNISHNVVLRLRVFVPANAEKEPLKLLEGNADQDALRNIDSMHVFYTGIEPSFADTGVLGGIKLKGSHLSIPLNISLKPGLHYLWLTASLKPSASMIARPEVHITKLQKNGKKIAFHEEGSGFKKRIAFVLRKKGEDNVNTYRIPGIATTDKGTLIAVYDIRYDNSRDLPADIDVGMSRSTDGGHTWQTMKVIMDMGEPHSNNGIGDPSILFDPVTNKIWVASLWSKGNRSIAGSIGGLSPDSTGQFMLSSSSDDGLTWSAPINITSQVKNPAWKIFFQGPGSGIAMQNGTLVFPAQYWHKNKVPYSTIIYSNDHGKTWKAGTGAKSNTTECAIVETTPGNLVLNMRDNRGRFRSTSSTNDMGKTWTETYNSYSALPDPVCQGSLIKEKVLVNGSDKEVLFFSNENNEYARTNTTVKASLDYGQSWLPAHQLLIDERSTYGYSSLTMVDKKTLGLLYEGVRDIYFIMIPMKEIIR